MTAVRTLVAWCPDWPLVAAGVAPDEPAAVVHANRVVACSPAARADGVAVGLRRRESQGRCPALTVLDHDPARDARAFEPVAVALEELTPRLEVSRPGRCAFPTRGPSRYFGGDEELAERAAALAQGAVGKAWSCRVGVADGGFAAWLAARAAGAAGRTNRVVSPGRSAAFLAPHPIDVLADPFADSTDVLDLCDLLRRLGLRTLGAFAALSAADVVARFGASGERAHRLARGLDDRPPDVRPLPPELRVEAELDPPAERVDTAAFVGKALADDLHARLAALGLACTRVAVEAETEHGEHLVRVWRHEGALSPGAIADRVRWQLDGWLHGSAAVRPSAGIVLLRLVPDEVVADRGRQLGFWGGAAEAGERASRALARLQGLLGPEAVRVPERRGGRGPAEQVALVPGSAVALGETPGVHADATLPWPGRLPAPSPATVHTKALPAEVVAVDGAPVGVNGRGEATAPPARLSVAGDRWVEVVAWAGPWPVDERWWDPDAHRRKARFQMVSADGAARLLTLESSRWWVEATYD